MTAASPPQKPPRRTLKDLIVQCGLTDQRVLRQTQELMRQLLRIEGEVQTRLDRIEKQLTTSQQREEVLMATTADLQTAVDALQAKVNAENDVIVSAATLLTSINQMLKDALGSGGTPDQIVAQVSAITATVDKKTQDLAASVAANTPAEP